MGDCSNPPESVGAFVINGKNASGSYHLMTFRPLRSGNAVFCTLFLKITIGNAQNNTFTSVVKAYFFCLGGMALGFVIYGFL